MAPFLLVSYGVREKKLSWSSGLSLNLIDGGKRSVVQDLCWPNVVVRSVHLESQVHRRLWSSPSYCYVTGRNREDRTERVKKERKNRGLNSEGRSESERFSGVAYLRPNRS